MKVLTILGTRPEIIRLSRVMAALDRHVEHVLVHTGQNYDYELNEIFFERANSHSAIGTLMKPPRTEKPRAGEINVAQKSAENGRVYSIR